MEKIYVKSSIFVLLSLSVLPTKAATLPLSGSVVDPSGAAVPGIAVELTRGGSGEVIRLVTDQYGKFHAVDLPAGSYDLSAVAPGFAPFAGGPFEAAAGRPLTIAVVLRLSSFSQQVTVSAKAPQAEGALETSSRNLREVLEAREARESAARDVGEALAGLDGLWMIRKGGIANDIVLRGFQQGNVDVLIDGQRIYGACPSHMDPSAFHVDFAEIDTVEVTKGPFDIRNQGSLGGAVRVASKRPEEGFRLTPSLSLGSFGFYNPSLAGSISRNGWHILGGYSYRRGDPYRDGADRPVTDYANYSAAGKRSAGFQANTSWARTGTRLGRSRLNLAYTRQQGGLTLYPGLQMDAPYDHADRLQADWNYPELTGMVKAVRMESYFTAVKHWMTDDLRSSSAGAPAGYSMGTLAESRTAGGRFEAELRDTILGLEAYHRVWNVNGSMMMGGMYTTRPSMPDIGMLVAGAYTRHDWQFGNLRLTVGARVDAAETAARAANPDTSLYFAYYGTRAVRRRDRTPSANVQATYALPRGIELFAGAGSMSRLPDPEERYYSVRRTGSDWVGNPTLGASRNNETDLGLNLRTRFWSLRPTLFYSRLSGMIVPTIQPRVKMAAGVVNASARSYAAVDARMYGGEVSGSLAFSRAMMLTTGVSYTRGERVGGNLSEIPAPKARAALRYGRKTAFAEVNGLASARQDKLDAILLERPTPGYALAGAKAGVHTRRMNFAGGVDNLFDRLYYSHLSWQRDPYRTGVRIPEPGRTFYLNLSVTLD